MSPIEKRELVEKYPDKVFSGTDLAQKIRARLRTRITEKVKEFGQATSPAGKASAPMLGHIIVGDLAQSELYVKLKLRACDEVGIGNRGYKLAADTSEAELMAKVREL